MSAFWSRQTRRRRRTKAWAGPRPQSGGLLLRFGQEPVQPNDGNGPVGLNGVPETPVDYSAKAEADPAYPNALLFGLGIVSFCPPLLETLREVTVVV